jgi:L-methionine (R)-S-oxide reductase
MSEKTGLREDLRSEVEALVASDAQDRNQVVEDVREVENYLACSIHTRSELVVLIRDSDKIVGEFDIDSDTVGAFTQEDEALLDEMGDLISGRVASLAASYESG